MCRFTHLTMGRGGRCRNTGGGGVSWHLSPRSGTFCWYWRPKWQFSSPHISLSTMRVLPGMVLCNQAMLHWRGGAFWHSVGEVGLHIDSYLRVWMHLSPGSATISLVKASKHCVWLHQCFEVVQHWKTNPKWATVIGSIFFFLVLFCL